jgi:microcystin-dependent protein
MSSVLRRTGALSAVERHTVGDTKTSLVANDHVGWLMCDGRQLNVDDFRQLFAVIGYSFGGSGSTFNLPDPMGRVPGFVGQSSGGGNTWIMGDVSGEETHTLTIAEMPAHNHGTDASDNVIGNGLTGISGEHIHGITDPGHSHSYVNNTNNQGTDNAFNSETAADDQDLTKTTSSETTGITINPNGDHQHTIKTQGGGQPHNNMQPTIFLGNLFVYAGRLFKDATTTNTFPPNGNRNIY